VGHSVGEGLRGVQYATEQLPWVSREPVGMVAHEEHEHQYAQRVLLAVGRGCGQGRASQPRLSVFPCAAGAEAPPAGTEVRGLSITIRTGDDDLRGGSDVSVRVPGVTTDFVSLNGGAGLGNGSVHTGSITLPPGTRAEQVTSLEFRYRSGDCVACTTDNWNVDELLVTIGVRALGTLLEAPNEAPDRTRQQGVVGVQEHEELSGGSLEPGSLGGGRPLVLLP